MELLTCSKWIHLSQKKRYEGVRFNVISVMRGGVKFPGKKHYVTLEWPPSDIVILHEEITEGVQFADIHETCGSLFIPQNNYLRAHRPFKCYITQWGFQISRGKLLGRCGSTLLALRSGRWV